jgi:ribosomal protein L11 methyltransferase
MRSSLKDSGIRSLGPDELESVVAHLSADERSARRIVDVLGEILDPQESASAAFADAAGIWGVEVTFRHPPDEAAVRALVGLAAGPELAKALRFAPVTNRDWIASSLAGLPPVFAGRYIVHGAHSRGEIPVNRIGIEIEAALAFGTGHHGTTRGCLLGLAQITKRVRRRRPKLRIRGRKSGRSQTLDLGTGTGVLAIAAAKTFRVPVLASDLDRPAVITARQNARLNRVSGLVEVIQASGLSARRFRERGPFDLIFANILLRPLQQLAAPLARLTVRDARVVLSGLLPKQMSAALAAYRAQGLVLERRLILEDWATLVLIRPSRPRIPASRLR